MKFIYTFGDEGKEYFFSRDYHLIQADESRKLYVFVNNNEMNFEEMNVPCVFSDVLTF